MADKTPRFLRRANGVIEDHARGLEWFAEFGTTFNWDDVNLSPNADRIDGGGWRLPSLEELRSLVTPQRNAAHLFLDPVFRVSVDTGIVWSNDMPSAYRIWCVDFRTGKVLEEWDAPTACRNLVVVREAKKA